MHCNEQRWLELARQVAEAIDRRSLHSSDCVVLLPYAQLIAPFRQAFLKRAGEGGTVFVPQMETTQTWARRLWASRGGFEAGHSDYTGNGASDVLAAWRWLDGARLDRELLGPALMEAAQSIWRLAAAQTPLERGPWTARLRAGLTEAMEAPVLALEASLAQIALAWVGSSAYLTDVLHQAEPGLLVVIEGWQSDPLVDRLADRLSVRTLRLKFDAGRSERGQVLTHACQGQEEQAQRAAACVLQHLQEGRQPVALIAQDRMLTRRIAALLAGRGVAVRDETGWTLSTTRAAAALMALLRAARPQATCDEVFAWLGEIDAVDARGVQEAQAQLRRRRVRAWKDVGAAQPAAQALQAQVGPWLQGLRLPRPLSQWLSDFRQTLLDCRLWDRLSADPAGRAVLQSIGLGESGDGHLQRLSDRLSLAGWTEWVSQAMESATFAPEPPAQAQVLMIPLGQLLGRTPAAVVLPGADEQHLPVMPDLPGPWSARQRRWLGLPDREAAAAVQRSAWTDLLRHERVDLLWHTRDSAETRMPSALVRQLQLSGGCEPGTDPRAQRRLPATPVERAQAVAATLRVDRLSASAYEDLRACPYRFFAVRLLGLSPAEELDGQIDGRDLGRWLHDALRIFHESVQGALPDDEGLADRLDQAAQQALAQAGLDPVALLPHQASWPLLRDAYLRWWTDHSAQGYRFEAAEAWHEMRVDDVLMIGQIDRVDRHVDGAVRLIDYKTESKEKIKARLKRASEDTQLAFYAALHPAQSLSAFYLSLADRGKVHPIEQTQIAVLRELLRQGVRQDLARIHAGAPLPALGQGQSCQYCQARGLCRRDFVAEERQTP